MAARRSRVVASWALWDPSARPAAQRERLEEIIDRTGARVLVAGPGRPTAVVAREREWLARRIGLPPYPTPEDLELFEDKDRFAQRCRYLDVPIPPTWSATDAPAEATFPCLAKPVRGFGGRESCASRTAVSWRCSSSARTGGNSSTRLSSRAPTSIAAACATRGGSSPTRSNAASRGGRVPSVRRCSACCPAPSGDSAPWSGVP